MHRRLKLIGTLILLACLSGCGFLGTIGGGTGAVNVLGGQIARGGTTRLGTPLQQSPAPAQPGGYGGGRAGP